MTNIEDLDKSIADLHTIANNINIEYDTLAFNYTAKAKYDVMGELIGEAIHKLHTVKDMLEA